MKFVTDINLPLFEELDHLFLLKSVDLVELKLIDILKLLTQATIKHYKIYYQYGGFDLQSSSTELTSNDTVLVPLKKLPDLIQTAKETLNDNNRVSHTAEDGSHRYIILNNHSSQYSSFFELQTNQELTTLQRNGIKYIFSIVSSYVEVLEDSQYDNLTGLLNRNTFDENLFKIHSFYQSDKSIQRSFSGDDQRNSSDMPMFFLGIVDIDHFKQVNDTLGHVYGDEVLLLLARLMRNEFRARDLLFRFGGEEFVIIISVNSPQMAHQILERFRQAVENYPFPQLEKITVSIGYAVVDNSYQMPVEVIDKADKALYYAKENGRNQIRSYENLLAESKVSASVIKSEVVYFDER